MSRKNKDGSVKTYFYLAENYREDGKMKTRLLKPLTAEEAKKIGKRESGTVARSVFYTSPYNWAQIEERGREIMGKNYRPGLMKKAIETLGIKLQEE